AVSRRCRNCQPAIWRQRCSAHSDRGYSSQRGRRSWRSPSDAYVETGIARRERIGGSDSGRRCAFNGCGHGQIATASAERRRVAALLVILALEREVEAVLRKIDAGIPQRAFEIAAVVLQHVERLWFFDGEVRLRAALIVDGQL